jgi:hypothetical protein
MSFIVQCSSLTVHRSVLAAGLLLLLSIACQNTPTNDHTPPEVHCFSPAYGDTLQAGIFTMTALATDDAGMERVTFWRDSTLLGFTDHHAGDTWSLVVDGRTGFLGTRLLGANAVDLAHNQASDTIRVFFVP